MNQQTEWDFRASMYKHKGKVKCIYMRNHKREMYLYEKTQR